MSEACTSDGVTGMGLDMMTNIHLPFCTYASLSEQLYMRLNDVKHAFNTNGYQCITLT